MKRKSDRRLESVRRRNLFKDENGQVRSFDRPEASAEQPPLPGAETPAPAAPERKSRPRRSQQYSSHSRIHTRYLLKDGTEVPGTTSITGVLDKPGLVGWAWKLGRDGLSLSHKDDLAAVGKFAHALVLAHLAGGEVDGADYTGRQIDLGENSFLKYLSWEKGKKVKPILVETPLVSEQYRYGGTPDFYGLLDDEPTLIDFKSGKAIYEEHWYQLAAYRQLLIESGHEVKCCRVLQIGRSDEEGFSEKVRRSNLFYEFNIFVNCLTIHNLKAKIKSEGL